VEAHFAIDEFEGAPEPAPPAQTTPDDEEHHG
jgi:hypothetical protein